LLLEDEQELVTGQRLPYPLDTVEDAIAQAGAQCLTEGITACVDAGIGAGIESLSALDLAAFARLRARGKLPVRVQLMPFHGVLHPLAGHERDGVSVGLDLGLTQGFGDDWLSLGAVKLWFDGGMMARSAAFTEPYEGTDDLGLLAEEPETLIDRVLQAHRSGWQVAAHAIGDRAIDVAIEAFERAQRDTPRPDLRHRIEHGGYVRDDQVARLGALGIAIASQPCFLWGSGDDFTRVVGPERARGLYRGRSLLDAGVRLVGSTDRPLPGTPLRAMQVLVERRSDRGLAMGPEEAVSVDEAIRAFTRDAAWAAGWEERLGSLAPGKLADFTLLGADPGEVEPAGIGEIPVLATYLDGQARWERSA
ncbi:amidohydrolase, partial [Leucobacter sp. M11]|uniref:amidohydrolase n=1 Tax=Leucobacter sp. M11 TaxID=2993565 RepID=UPI002D7FF948